MQKWVPSVGTSEVPDQRWDVLHMDFITDLQSTAEEWFDSILVCTDRLSRYSGVFDSD